MKLYAMLYQYSNGRSKGICSYEAPWFGLSNALCCSERDLLIPTSSDLLLALPSSMLIYEELIL